MDVLCAAHTTMPKRKTTIMLAIGKYSTDKQDWLHINNMDANAKTK